MFRVMSTEDGALSGNQLTRNNKKYETHGKKYKIKQLRFLQTRLSFQLLVFVFH